MQRLLTHETPEKIIGLISATLFSMALLFGVTVTNASFHSVEYTLPDPFAPANVVSLIDNASANYSKALLNFAQPAREAFAVYMDQINWIAMEAKSPIFQALGLEGLTEPHNTATFRVAGAFTEPKSAYQSVSVDTLYAFLIDQ